MQSVSQPNPQRQALRKQIRQRRRELLPAEQQSASHDLLTRFKQSLSVRKAGTIALYLAVDGEIDTRSLIEYCWQEGKQVYLPVLHPFSPGHLLFLRYTRDTLMADNRYGIAEPVLDIRGVCPAEQLDLVCTPLVAFDDSGQRLGMGGGYYDRTLAPWFQSGTGPAPLGLAHDCQQVDLLPSELWDVPLPEILTPSKHWSWPLGQQAPA